MIPDVVRKLISTAALRVYTEAVHERPMVAAKAWRDRIVLGVQMLRWRAMSRPASPSRFTSRITSRIHRLHSGPCAVPPGTRRAKRVRYALARGVEQIAVRQPLRIVMMRRVFITPDDLACGGDFVEVAAMPHRPRRVTRLPSARDCRCSRDCRCQDHCMASRAHRHLPLMDDRASDVDQKDMATGRLRRDQRIAAGGSVAGRGQSGRRRGGAG